jgi:murein DD-endopeptidase MepM/ murein hydrolase activator NlpD
MAATVMTSARRRVASLMLVGVALAAAAAIVTAGLVAVILGGSVSSSSSAGCIPQDITDRVAAMTAGPVNVPGFSSAQLDSARVIVETGRSLDVPDYGLVIAVAVAIQESSLTNIGHGDVAGPDSRGLFQQRAPWGSLADRLDPEQAATMFFTGGHGGQPGLLDIVGWQKMQLGEAAQSVQRSADPLGLWYELHEPVARSLVEKYGGSPVNCALAAELITGDVVLPIHRGAYVLTARWGQRGPRWASGYHTGLDFAAPAGTPIYSIADGQVSSAGMAGPYGNRTMVHGTDGNDLWYCHQSRLEVHTGEQVTAGQLIGFVGSTGNVTGPHLHLEVHLDGGPDSDPAVYLKARGVIP